MINRNQIPRTKQEIEQLAVETYKEYTPVDTGYQYSQIYTKPIKNGFVLVVNTDYVQYTTDALTDRMNPNEGWDKRAYEALKEKIRGDF